MTSELKSLIDKVSSEKTRHILKVHTEAMYAVHTTFRDAGFVQLRPVILSPITDPLNHEVSDASIEYQGQILQLTKSMIIHKQLALIGDLDRIYIDSPNVRLESPDCASSGRHLLEFSQIDMELKVPKEATEAKGGFMFLMENLLMHVIQHVKRNCKEELSYFNRDLQVPKRPLKFMNLKI